MVWLVLLWSIGAAWILLLGDVARSLLQKPLRSPAQWVRLFGRVLLPVSSVILALSLIGHQGGWLHDGAKSALGWTALGLSASAVVWAFGEDRMVKVLAARTAARQGQSE